MKRSEVEWAINWAKGFLKKENFTVPEFGYWKKEDFEKAQDIDRIKQLMLGWDVTDYGMGDFRKLGSILFTVRNGSIHDPSAGTPYAEKLIPILEGQRLPMHFHYSKTEDIINRAGGILYIRLYNSREDGLVDDKSDVTVYMDGIKKIVGAGEELEITTGNSITLTPGLYHLFGAKDGFGDLLVGEVSAINDDNCDNHFAEQISRFSQIEEDTDQTVILCNEYGRLPGKRGQAQ
jgi:D-lyxose ketol-isomerase